VVAGSDREVFDRDTAVLDVVVLQPEQRKHRWTEVGVVDPRTRQAVLRNVLRLVGPNRRCGTVKSVVGHTRADHAEPCEVDVLAFDGVTPGQVSVVPELKK
jgi:hypothetical protein